MPSEVKEYKYVMFADAASFAAAAAHAATSRLCGLLDGGDEMPMINNWYFDGDDPDAESSADDINRIISELGAYVCNRQVEKAETLYLHARTIKGVVHAEKRFADERFERRQAWEIFRVNCLAVHNAIDGAQKQIEAEALNAAQSENIKPVKIEDTIFEPYEKMGDLREESVEAAKIAAKNQPAKGAKTGQPKGGSLGKKMPAKTKQAGKPSGQAKTQN